MTTSLPCPICAQQGRAAVGHVDREWRLLDGKTFATIVVCRSCPDKSRACTSSGTGPTQAQATAAAWAQWRSIGETKQNATSATS